METENFNQINSGVANLSDAEKKERRDKIEREKLVEEFDKENADLKEALKNNPEIYKEQRDKWVTSEEEANLDIEEINIEMENKAQAIKDAEKQEEAFNLEMEEFNLEMEKAVKEKREAMIDKVTGLEQRPGLYKMMDKEFEKYFNEEDFSYPQKFIEAINNNDIDFRDVKLTIAFGDISFLSLANKAGHDVGDNLLAKMASKIKNEGAKAFRHGGDELTVFYNKEKYKVEDSVAKIKKSITEIDNIAILKQHNLEPNIDIRVAHFYEAVDVFKGLVENLSKTDEGRKALEAMNTTQELQSIWVKIADQRASLEKGETRIPLLIKIKKEDPENYKEVIGSLRKGGYDATDVEIDTLGMVAEKDQEKIIKLFIMQKENKILAGEDDFYKHARSEAVLKKVLENN